MERLRFVVLLLFFMGVFQMEAQIQWSEVTEEQLPADVLETQKIVAKKYQLVQLRPQDLLKDNGGLMELPLPNGEFLSAELTRDNVLPEKVAKKYPQIRPYRITPNGEVYGGAVTVTHKGVHALIQTKEGLAFVEPVSDFRNDYHFAYYVADAIIDSEYLHCGTAHSEMDIKTILSNWEKQSQLKSSAPVTLRTYDLACATTGEYTEDKGGTLADALAHMTMTVNAMNVFFEGQVAIRFEFIDDIEDIIFTDSTDDPYPNREANEIFNMNTDVLNDYLGTNNYDIGHVFGEDCQSSNLSFPVAGISGFRIACQTTNRGRGISCHFGNDLSFILTTTHEFGHHYGASHTWNKCNNATSGQRSGGTAFEPGAGVTIMSYANSCDSENNAGPRRDYFHIGSVAQMIDYSRQRRGDDCPSKSASGNSDPIVQIAFPDNLVIPINTPLELEMIATDPNGDSMIYNWEQTDTGPEAALGEVTGDGPAFISETPNESTTRSLPNLNQVLVSSLSSKTEVLPDYDRVFTMQANAWDMKAGGGGVGSRAVNFFSDEGAGPFFVTKPHFPQDWAAKEQADIVWQVANTDNVFGVDCQFVDIYLSIDGGQTFPYILADRTPNDGMQTIDVPDIKTALARVKIKGNGHIFYDISNFNFSIKQPGFNFSTTGGVSHKACLPDPLTIDLQVSSILSYDSLVTFSVVNGLPTGALASFSSNEIRPGEGTAMTLDFAPDTPDDVYTIQIMGEAENADDVTKIILVEVVSSDFSSFAQISPAQNAMNQSSDSIRFEWTDVEDADFYTFQLATNPAFEADDLINDVSQTGDLFLDQTSDLENDQYYFWRNRAGNVCNMSDWSQTQIFTTGFVNMPVPPQLVINDPLSLAPGSLAFLTDLFLFATDDQTPTDELEFVLITIPSYGQLLINDIPLNIGEGFTQMDITNGIIRYEHTGIDEMQDGFTFLLRDNEGGWIGSTPFVINIDNNATSVLSTGLESTLSVFPNPAQQHFFVRHRALEKDGALHLSLETVDGSTISNLKFAQNDAHSIRVETSGLSSGIYLVKLLIGEEYATGKVVITD